MAASYASSFPLPIATQTGPAAHGVSNRRRQITPQAGRALEILGNAIEYVTDEFVQDGGRFSPSTDQIEAVQLLMALNREVYFECPVIPTLGERFRKLLHLQIA